MTARQDIKGDETVAFRVPEQTAAWLRDRARVLGITPSLFMRQIVEQALTGEQACKPLPAFANNPKPDDVAAELAVLRAALGEMARMIKAGNGPRMKRSRTA
ncbi:MAG: hypothetical protein JW730_18320 [Anaerolineales bacterium]|nr:hypothetical protein [Anaerolineales bacterium]